MTDITVNVTDETVAVVTIPEDDVTVAVTDETISVVTVAEQGPAGPAGVDGQPGGAPFVWDQPIPSATWTIVHTLGHEPAGVVVTDNGGETVYGEMHIDSATQVTLIFGAPFSGVARLL